MKTETIEFLKREGARGDKTAQDVLAMELDLVWDYGHRRWINKSDVR